MTARLRILDLFCGAGLVAEGLARADWEVVGVDLEPQRRYPGPFIQHNALTLDDRFLRSFDAIWASPPCLKDTTLHASARREQAAHGRELTQHPDLITPTQALLRRIGLPYVIENVANCKLLKDPVIICGSQFGLGATIGDRRFHLERHRKFETNWPLHEIGCAHQKPVVGVYGSHARIRAVSAGGRGSKEPLQGRSHVEVMIEAMGCRSGLTAKEVGQGIPPAYATYVGHALRWHLKHRVAA